MVRPHARARHVLTARAAAGRAQANDGSMVRVHALCERGRARWHYRWLPASDDALTEVCALEYR